MTSRIWIDPIGNAGNRALQYLAAMGIAQHAPDAVVENFFLPEWGLVSQPAAPPPPINLVVTGGFRFWLDVAGLADCLRRKVVDTVLVNGYSYHLDNYPPRAAARQLLGWTPDGHEATGFGPRELVCSVRAAEILDLAHPNYLPLPPNYYKMLQARTGLDLVFFGQIADELYCNALRREFPEARFIPGRNPQYDFDMLRRSANIAPSISTFAWLAAWLSEAERIYLPVGGIFSPIQQAQQLFLPLDDPEYEFILLPYTEAVNVRQSPAQFALQQNLLAEQARPITVPELRGICSRAAAFAPRQPLLGGFDPAYYLSIYQDVAAAIGPDLPSALHHYLHAGFQQNRRPFAIDPVFYTSLYPDAAMAIAEGHFADPVHHYIAAGRAAGYRPIP